MRTLAKRRRPSGLAMLELVMALPILLALMALMVNFGTVACWKIRALPVARHGLWSHRQPYNGLTNPNNDYWPNPPGRPGVAGAGNLTTLTNESTVSPPPSVAGGQPLLSGMQSVNPNAPLDPTRGSLQSTTTVTRTYPFLGTSLGQYSTKARDLTLNDKWEWWTAAMAWGNSSFYDTGGTSSPATHTNSIWNNYARRIPVLYGLMGDCWNWSDFFALGAPIRSMYSQMTTAGQSPAPPSTNEGILPLNPNEADKLHYYSTYYYPAYNPAAWTPQTYYDGYRICNCAFASNALQGCTYCTLDKEVIQQAVTSYVGWVQGDDTQIGVAALMKNDLIKMYQSVLKVSPPASATDIANAQANLNALQ